MGREKIRATRGEQVIIAKLGEFNAIGGFGGSETRIEFPEGMRSDTSRTGIILDTGWDVKPITVRDDMTEAGLGAVVKTNAGLLYSKVGPSSWVRAYAENTSDGYAPMVSVRYYAPKDFGYDTELIYEGVK